MKSQKFLLAASALLVAVLAACGGSDDNGDAPSVANPNKFFNRTATFLVCDQIGSSCESDDETAAEIVAASTDGMTLVYTNSPGEAIGFVDITDVQAPVALGALPMPGEPTSVTVVGANAMVAVNTSADYVNVAGKLMVVDIATRTTVAELDLPGQPDSVAASKDGRYLAIVIENERDEDLGDGAPPQLPAGSLVIVDMVGAPATWQTRTVDLTGIADLFPEDPEPEYVDINKNNIAVVTLQENNHIALVDLKTGTVTRHFSAGSVSLEKIDATDAPRPNQVAFTQSLANVLREPDGVAWISTEQFVTANEGDLDGGSRSFTVFNADGSVAYEAGAALEHLAARIGHYNDRRSDAKGNEPENAEFARFDGTDYAFIASERSNFIAVYDMSAPSLPVYKQVLPAAQGPEGVLAIPSRNLLIAASEVDSRGDLARSGLNIYQYQSATTPDYPTIQSADRADGTPIPFAALSGLAAGSGSLVYAIEDSFFGANRIFEIDTSAQPARLVREIRITDPDSRIPALAASLSVDTTSANAFDDADLAALRNADGTVNIDPEGIAVASAGGFWVASEGSGTVGDAAYPVRSANLLFKVSATGVIEDIIMLPGDVDAKQVRFGFEGVTESNGKLVVAFQRAWAGETQPRLGVFDLTARTWQFAFYPLDAATSPNGGWVGLSDITALGNDSYLIVERDNQYGPDARIKRLYRVSLAGVAANATVTKVLVRDLLDDLKAPGGVVYEKIEGLAVTASGNMLIVNDNDGVDSNSGEIQLLNLGALPN